MKVIDLPQNKVYRALLLDEVNNEGGELIVSDGNVAAVKVGDFTKVLLSDYSAPYKDILREIGACQNVVLLGAPIDEREKRGFEAVPCKTFAYLDPLPPTLRKNVEIKKLAPTLSSVIAENYDMRGKRIPAEEAEELIRGKGIFGAFIDSSFAGFIGRHSDGTMGLLTVFDEYKRRGVGEELEKFLINYVMSYGRTPLCDVFWDNAPSLSLQQKLGLNEAPSYTFWIGGDLERYGF